jgi:uncharacterized membrane protein YbhN (UPF0104 family)
MWIPASDVGRKYNLGTDCKLLAKSTLLVTFKSTFVLFFSTLAGLLLIFFLAKAGRVNLRLTVQQLLAVSGTSFIKLVVLTGLHIFLADQKWRNIDKFIRSSSDSIPTKTTSFALTSVGVTLGQVLPVQLSMTLTRTLGTGFYGNPLKRGTAGTLFEQSFDLVVVLSIAFASVLTVVWHGGAVVWIACALAMTGLAALGLTPFVRMAGRIASSCGDIATPSKNRILRKVIELQRSGLLNIGLAHRLLALSVARFIVQVLMAAQAAEAVGVKIPAWHLAAAMPFVVIACVIAVTPGGLGVNEISYATALSLFGTPLGLGAQWAVANRFLVLASCFAVAFCSVTVFCVQRLKVLTIKRRLQDDAGC